MLDLRPVPIDHPDALAMIAELQAFYTERYGDGDATPLHPGEFAAPAGYFALGYVDGVAAVCGGWRARDAEYSGLRDGDAELKRMYVRVAFRGQGHARALLAHLEASAAAAGRTRVVLETGTLQPEAMALYTSAGYGPIGTFGLYRDEPNSRCFAKVVSPADGRPAVDELSAQRR